MFLHLLSLAVIKHFINRVNHCMQRRVSATLTNRCECWGKFYACTLQGCLSIPLSCLCCHSHSGPCESYRICGTRPRCLPHRADFFSYFKIKIIKILLFFPFLFNQWKRASVRETDYFFLINPDTVTWPRNSQPKPRPILRRICRSPV